MKKILLIAVILVIGAMGLFYWVLTNIQTPEVTQINTPTTPTNTNNENPPTNDFDQTVSMVDEKSGIMFDYPEDLNYEYVSAQEWPPRFISSFAPIDCELEEQTQAMSGQSDRTETINGTVYCIWERNEGAAGSTYTNYQVSYAKDNQYLTMSFTLKYPQCGNYPEEEKRACEAKQSDFPLNELIDKIAQSASLPSY